LLTGRELLRVEKCTVRTGRVEVSWPGVMGFMVAVGLS